MIEVALAAVFLLLIPVNVSVAREVAGIASEKPRIELLSLVAYLVAVLALAACVFGLFSTASVLRLLTGTIVIPPPIAAVVFVVCALVLSTANLWVRRYLRRRVA